MYVKVAVLNVLSIFMITTPHYDTVLYIENHAILEVPCIIILFKYSF